ACGMSVRNHPERDVGQPLHQCEKRKWILDVGEAADPKECLSRFVCVSRRGTKTADDVRVETEALSCEPRLMLRLRYHRIDRAKAHLILHAHVPLLEASTHLAHHGSVACEVTVGGCGEDGTAASHPGEHPDQRCRDPGAALNVDMAI